MNDQTRMNRQVSVERIFAENQARHQLGFSYLSGNTLIPGDRSPA